MTRIFGDVAFVPAASLTREGTVVIKKVGEREQKNSVVWILRFLLELFEVVGVEKLPFEIRVWLIGIYDEREAAGEGADAAEGSDESAEEE